MEVDVGVENFIESAGPFHKMGPMAIEVAVAGDETSEVFSRMNWTALETQRILDRAEL